MKQMLEASISEIVPEKNCKTCGELKPLTKYKKCKTTRDGREGTCGACRRLAVHYADVEGERAKRRAITNRYRLNNRADYSAGKISESAKYRETAKLLLNTLTESEWSAIKNYYDNSCAFCGSKPQKLVRCRIVPVSKGGGFTARNVIALCARCSASKKEKVIYPVTMHDVGIMEEAKLTEQTSGAARRRFAGPS